MTKYIEINGMGEVVPRSEYDALAAQVEALRREIQSAADWFSAYWPELNKAQCDRIRQMDKIAKATPQHHLRDLLAEAGRLGYIEGAMNYDPDDDMDLGVDYYANQYADSIRQEGK